jgi:hypothetical protein
MLDPLSWFYEQREGLVLINEPVEGARTTKIVIPWSKLERAVENHRSVKKIGTKAKRLVGRRDAATR